MSVESEKQLSLSREWVEKIVVGMNLCPFAAPVIKQATLHYAISQADELDALQQFFLTELARIQAATEQQIATSLLIMPNAVTDFYDYLDLLSDCEHLLKKAGLGGEFQLASFHPRYVFQGVEENDISHWTNRSPYPMIHIIREGQMSRVLANFKDPDSIPERNIALLRKIGKQGLIERFSGVADY